MAQNTPLAHIRFLELHVGNASESEIDAGRNRERRRQRPLDTGRVNVMSSGESDETDRLIEPNDQIKHEPGLVKPVQRFQIGLNGRENVCFISTYMTGRDTINMGNGRKQI